MRQGLLARLTEQGGNLLGQLEQASQRLNQLLAPENQKSMVTAVDKLSQAAAGIGQLTRHADQVLTGSGPEGSASLPRVAAQADATLKSMQTTSERLKDSAELVKASAERFRQTNVRISEPGGTLDRIARSTEALSASTATLNSSLLPRLSRTTEDAGRTVRQFGRVADGLAEQPQSLLWGRAGALPGPGEPGFAPPAAAAADH
jgi:phospholipid/cholesterol/gamma-HCH transport system substrate-binding protein